MRTFQARVKFALRDILTGDELMAYDERFNGLLHIMGPTTINLGAGEVYNSLDLGSELKSYVSGASVLVLATDTPGVQYVVGADPIPRAALTPRYLLTGAEDILSGDFSSAPSATYAGAGNWLNHTGAPGAGAYANVEAMRYAIGEDYPVQMNGNTILIQGADAQGNNLHFPCVRHIWGRDNKVDLGAVNDSLEFRWWQRIGTGPPGHFRFGSYPYTTETREEDLADATGATTDPVYAAPPSNVEATVQNAMGAFYQYEGSADQGVDNIWSTTEAPKSFFTAFNHPVSAEACDWSRITWFEYLMDYGATSPGTTNYCGPIGLIHRGQGYRTLDTCAVELLNFTDASGPYDRSRISITLLAPTAHAARVQLFLGVA